jgi:outer membrane protein OmpA-like peptidoglycan-associated protein
VRTRSAAALGLLALALGLAGLALWPDSICSEPSCAQLRFRLSVELDSLREADAFPLVTTANGSRFGAAELLAEGGVAVEVVRGDAELPYDASAGALDEADLAAYAEAWSERDAPPAGSARVYALSAPELRSASGDLLFGVLFDHAGREAIAVAPNTTRRLFAERHRELVPLLQLRTFTHELLHALNRYHVDAAHAQDGRLTLEAPTHCIADPGRGAWKLRELPLWALSPSTIRHFQSARAVDVLPGARSSPFDVARGTARDCELARGTPMTGARSRLRRLLDRLPSLTTAAWAQEAETADAAPDGASADLRLEAQRAAYPLGFPIIVRAHVVNTGTRPLALAGRLAPAYGLLRVETRAEGERDWRALRPLQVLDALDHPAAVLAPGVHTAEAIEIFFGEDGWTFPSVGRYEVRARMRLGEAEEERISKPVAVEIAAASFPADERALAPLLDAHGALDPQVGRFMAFHGRIRDPAVQQRLESVLRDAPETALAAALRLSAAGAALRAPIDPLTGLRRAPDLPVARRLLGETCRESGVAALGRALLHAAEQEGGEPGTESRGAEGDALGEPWEGARVSQTPTRLRYGDPALELVGAPIGFAVGSVALDGAGLAALRALADELRQRSGGAILVAGHSDGAGTCDSETSAGLARADAAARELVRLGLAREALEVVSLGANRPLDFASSETAAGRNRRVEIWVVSPAPEPSEPAPPEPG